MKFKKYASNKVIATVLSIMLVVGGFFHQQHKINELERQIYIEQHMTDQRYNYTETEIDLTSLKEALNERCQFKIFDGTINIKHTYVYQRDSLLGMKSKCKLVGTADFYYAFIVNLQDSEIVKADKDKIIIEVPKAELDKASCHRVANTFVRMSDECDVNLLTNRTDTERATRQWEDTFDTKGINHLDDYYKYTDQQDKLEKATVHQIKTLLEELGYSQSLEVVIK